VNNFSRVFLNLAPRFWRFSRQIISDIDIVGQRTAQVDLRSETWAGSMQTAEHRGKMGERTSEGAMVAWWKRLILSAISWLVAGAVFGAILALQNIVFNPNAHFEAAELLGGIWVVVLCSLPGWLLAIPVVLIAKDLHGWRFRVYWAIGSCIGPLLIYSVALYFFLTSPNTSSFAPEAKNVVYLATAISSLTTIIYLLLLRWAHTRAAADPSTRSGRSG
jgi:hypothetical protein